MERNNTIRDEIKQELLELNSSLEEFDKMIDDMGVWDTMGRWQGVRNMYGSLYAQNLRLVEEKGELLKKIAYYEKTYGKKK